ncbi:hypothetical protein [Actinoplanes sp. NPDC020271]|uniref:hypothetical protein n=1 Tax=Actinoplanes sp. NPDC020271 TaxID=3363896 RepID=UPI0037B08D72
MPRTTFPAAGTRIASAALIVTAFSSALVSYASPVAAVAGKPPPGVSTDPDATVQARPQKPFLVCVYQDGRLLYCDIYA